MYEHDFCEYAVKKKIGGAYLAKLVLAMLASAVFVVCFFVLILRSDCFSARSSSRCLPR